MKSPSQDFRRYISTQGPLPDTFADFWQLVWEQDSYVIVMLTKQEEMNKVCSDIYIYIYTMCLRDSFAIVIR